MDAFRANEGRVRVTCIATCFIALSFATGCDDRR